MTLELLDPKQALHNMLMELLLMILVTIGHRRGHRPTHQLGLA